MRGRHRRLRVAGTDPEAVDVAAVVADDRLIEQLRAGGTRDALGFAGWRDAIERGITDGPPLVGLDVTRFCPDPPGCEVCGAVDELVVVTADIPVGVICVGLCVSCLDGGEVPRLGSWAEGVRRVGLHAAHLGLDVDQAEALRRP